MIKLKDSYIGHLQYRGCRTKLSSSPCMLCMRKTDRKNLFCYFSFLIFQLKNYLNLKWLFIKQGTGILCGSVLNASSRWSRLAGMLSSMCWRTSFPTTLSGWGREPQGGVVVFSIKLLHITFVKRMACHATSQNVQSEDFLSCWYPK